MKVAKEKRKYQDKNEYSVVKIDAVDGEDVYIDIYRSDGTSVSIASHRLFTTIYAHQEENDRMDIAVWDKGKEKPKFETELVGGAR